MVRRLVYLIATTALVAAIALAMVKKGEQAKF